jgi:hypothetical protein
MVLIGVAFGSDPQTGDVILISDSKGDFIDHWKIDVASAIGEISISLPRRMLVPASGSVQTSQAGTTVLSLIQCRTLDDAVAIL